jgi:hypothetical protein
MGLRDKIKGKIKKALDNFSGEHSSEAPQDRTPYERGEEDENVEVVMAKLNRPKGIEKNEKPSS